jgi:hypothetical protein
MLRRVTVVRADISEERIASIFKVTGIGELGKTLAVTSKGIHCITSSISSQYPSIGSYC